ncbi:hypothetical protein E2C01_027758 [Portunus trituberculatus]|uniref:Uncharacterized protein n=1 Tax=Portunus trituberculatus TaxID=210409 RepID=A0A5B7EN19_PORTR|nr:hypothetical protein [Portunus trituberculatus]
MDYGEFIKLVVHQLLTRCSPGYWQLSLKKKKDLSLKRMKFAMVEEPSGGDKCHGMVPIPPTEKKA